MNLGTLLPRHARFRPGHTAVVFEEKRLTFRELNSRVNRVANAFLAEGIRKGDKIATILPNCLPVPCYDLLPVTEFAVVLREAVLRASPAPLS